VRLRSTIGVEGVTEQQAMLLDEDRQVQMSWSAHRAAGSRKSAALA
jgi:hypothetical protein